MNPRSVSDPLVRDTPLLRCDDTVERAVAHLLDTDLPALPVVDDDRRFRGILGEREVLAALFPAYLGELHAAGFVPRSLEAALEKRAACRVEAVATHMTTEHVDVGPDFSDTQVAETFLHHRVLILPVLDDGQVAGVITRSDFFHALARRFISSGGRG
jgi:CBS-domain-containing membrane protein